MADAGNAFARDIRHIDSSTGDHLRDDVFREDRFSRLIGAAAD